jgi:hypothetical protein
MMPGGILLRVRSINTDILTAMSLSQQWILYDHTKLVVLDSGVHIVRRLHD